MPRYRLCWRLRPLKLHGTPGKKGHSGQRNDSNQHATGTSRSPMYVHKEPQAYKIVVELDQYEARTFVVNIRANFTTVPGSTVDCVLREIENLLGIEC